LVERFNPDVGGQALASPPWLPPQMATRNGFAERTIGELVRAIVTRLGEEGPASTGSI
jgi:hypothetical protein